VVALEQRHEHAGLRHGKRRARSFAAPPSRDPETRVRSAREGANEQAAAIEGGVCRGGLRPKQRFQHWGRGRPRASERTGCAIRDREVGLTASR